MGFLVLKEDQDLKVTKGLLDQQVKVEDLGRRESVGTQDQLVNQDFLVKRGATAHLAVSGLQDFREKKV